MRLFDKINENIKYQTYLNLQELGSTGAILCSGISSILGSIGYTNNNGLLLVTGIVGTSASLASAWYRDYSMKNKGYLKTKDIRSATALYDDFIKYYVNYNKRYSINDGVSIATAYNYWLKNGGLSKDGEIGIVERKSINIPELLGANVLTGSNKAKHVSSMLTDILNKSGIEAHTVTIKPQKTRRFNDKDKQTMSHFLDHDSLVENESPNVGSLLERIEKEENNTFALITEGRDSFVFDPLTGGKYSNSFGKQSFLRSNEDTIVDGIPSNVDIVSPTISDQEVRFRLRNSIISLDNFTESTENTLLFCKKNPYIIAQFSKEREVDYDKMEKVRRSITGDRSLAKRLQPIKSTKQ